MSLQAGAMVLFFCHWGVCSLFYSINNTAWCTLMLHISMMDPRSRQAEGISQLTLHFFIAASFILIIVTFLTFLFLFRYKAKPGDAIPPKVYRSRKAEVAIIGIPLLLVCFFFFKSCRLMSDLLPEEGNAAPEVLITAHQWWWEAYYPESGASTANEIHLPVGRTILLRFTSADVIHDWWVPQLGNKMDILPGAQTHLWLHINEPGYYEGACSEFCGKQHAWMRIRVYADDEQHYRQWLALHSSQAPAPRDSLSAYGMQVFNEMTCGNCHTIKGTKADGTSGPELTHVASRHTLLTGMLQNNSANLERWISHPDKVKPGAYMPVFLMDKRSRDALVHYLMQLQ